MKNVSKGSAVVELTLLVSVWAVLISGFLTCFQLELKRQRALSAARLGAALYSSGHVENAVIDSEMRNYLPNQQWSWTLRRFTRTSASRFYRLLEAHVEAPVSFFPSVIKESVVLQEASEL